MGHMLKIATILIPAVSLAQNAQLAAPLPDYSAELSRALAQTTDQDQAGTIAKALKTLSPESAAFGDICKLVDTKPQSLYAAFSAQKLAAQAACDQLIAVDTDAILKYAKTEQADTNVPNLFYAVHVLRKAKALGNQDNRNTILDNLSNAYEKSEKSIADAAIAMLAGIEAGGAKLGKFASLKKRVDLGAKILTGSEQFDYSRLVIESGNLEIASLAVRATVATAKASQEQLLPGDAVVQLANGFLLAEPKSALEKAYVVQALAALNAENTGLSKPVSVSKSGEYPTFSFKMTDVFGKPVTSSRFSVKVGDQIEDLDVSGQADMSVFGLEAGVHSFELSVSGGSSYAGANSGSQHKLLVPSSAKINLSNPSIKVQKKGKSESKNVADSTVITLGDKLIVSFQVTDLTPHQTVVRFVNGELEGFALAKTSHGHQDLYTATVDVEASATGTFSGTSGVWAVEAIIGDSTVGQAVQQNLGSIELTLPADMELDRQTHFEPKKTINHVFPEAEQRPPAALSNMFTMITLAPLAVLIILWGIIGFNLRLLTVSIWGLLFHVSMAAVLALYIGYWLGVYNMFLTIRYLAIIGVVLMVSGNKHLTNLANARREKPKSE